MEIEIEKKCFEDVKLEKERAMMRYNHLQSMARLIRVVGAVVSLWCCVPPALYYLRTISAFLATPVFFFLLCNAIILILLANSRQSSSTPEPQFHVPDQEPVVYQDKEMIPVMTEETETVVAEIPKAETEEVMSNEEFQRQIEEFIARQLKFRRQESMPGLQRITTGEDY